MKYLLILVVLSSMLFFSCEKNDNDNELLSTTDLVIKTGAICGFCSIVDSLIITKDSTIFKDLSMCDENVVVHKKKTNVNDWNDLINAFNQVTFSKIDLNTCNACVDGCDEWILVKDNSFNHKISFTPNDSTNLKTIQVFADKLNAMRQEYYND